MKNFLIYHLHPAKISVLLLLIAGFGNSVYAATFTVSNTNDGGAGSLRQAILEANASNADDVIEFDAAGFNNSQTITITSGEFVITPDNASGVLHALTINGTGAKRLTVSGDNQYRVFKVNRNADFTVKNMKVTKGNNLGNEFNNAGGGFLADGASRLTLINVYLTGTGE